MLVVVGGIIVGIGVAGLIGFGVIISCIVAVSVLVMGLVVGGVIVCTYPESFISIHLSVYGIK